MGEFGFKIPPTGFIQEIMKKENKIVKSMTWWGTGKSFIAAYRKTTINGEMVGKEEIGGCLQFHRGQRHDCGEWGEPLQGRKKEADTHCNSISQCVYTPKGVCAFEN